MIILDTNVLSGLMRSTPDPLVVRWLDDQPAPSLWTTAVTLFEVRYGLLSLPAGRRRTLDAPRAGLLQENWGGRFSMKARTASWWSALRCASD